MICPVCRKAFPFFHSGGKVYCSQECADRAVKQLERLLERMEQAEMDDFEDWEEDPDQ